MFNIVFNKVTEDSKDRTSATDRTGRQAVSGEPTRQTKILNQCYRHEKTLHSVLDTEGLQSGPTRLPFVRRRSDLGQWMFDHRLGVLTTVALYMIAAIVFLSVRIKLDTNFISQGILVEFPPELEQLIEQQQTLEQLREQEEFNRQMLENVRNRISDDNASLDAGLRDDRGTRASDLYEEARQLQERLDANRRRYEAGLQESNPVAERNPVPSQNRGEGQEAQNVKVAGNVTGSFDLAGRAVVYFPIPSYRCQGGGKAVVQISVDRSGNVVSASIRRNESTSDNCILDMALQFAKMARFNADTGAPERQSGSITYLFIPQ